MNITTVKITNFRAIATETLSLDSGFNLIIGNNGIGKTAILEAIVVGLGGFIAGIKEVSTIHFKTDDIRISSELMGDGSYNMKYITPTSVECSVEKQKLTLK